MQPTLDELSAKQSLLESAYAAFNARDIDGALRMMTPDVEWPNGMEGGFVHGHAEVRAYWTRQWGMIDPHVRPVGFAQRPDGRVEVTVHQVVRSLAGEVLVDQLVRHVYTFDRDLVRRMDIE
jgi:ketosteroid isomerase-like protein